MNVIPNTMVDNMPGRPARPKLTPAMPVRLAQISHLEPTMESVSDTELQRKTEELRDRLTVGKVAVGGP